MMAVTSTGRLTRHFQSKAYRHRLAHKLGWFTGHVVSWQNHRGEMMIGFRCDKCGEISGIHRAPHIMQGGNHGQTEKRFRAE